MCIVIIVWRGMDMTKVMILLYLAVAGQGVKLCIGLLSLVSDNVSNNDR